MPLMRSFILDMEDRPQRISFGLIIPPDSAHVTEFITHGYYLRVMRSRSKSVDSRLFAVTPTILFRDTFGELVALRVHEVSYTVAELRTDLLHRHIGVLDRVMQRRSS